MCIRDRIHVGRGPPLNLGEQTRAVRRNLVSLIEPANQLRAPAQKPDGVVPPERQPIERVGVAARAAGRMYRFPGAEAVTVPGAAQGVECAVFLFQPFAELRLGSPAKAFLSSPLVPHVITQRGGLIAIALDQGGQELPGLAQDIFVIQAKGSAAGCATAANGGKALGTVAADVPRMGLSLIHI